MTACRSVRTDGLQVGQDRFGAVADLDAPALLLDVEGEEDAVVPALLADAPLAEDVVRELVGIIALGGLEDGDHHLGIAQLGRDLDARGGRDHAREVVELSRRAGRDLESQQQREP
jgi:hypothetical protein